MYKVPTLYVASVATALAVTLGSATPTFGGVVLVGDEPGAQLGRSVAVEGSVADGWVVVGAPKDRCGGAASVGAVAVVDRSTQASQELCARDGQDGDHFGYSVAIDGDTIVVGAPQFDEVSGDTTGPGAVYLFRLDVNGQWVEVNKINPEPAAGGEAKFGWVVETDVSDRLMFIGAPGHGGIEENAGAVYVYYDGGFETLIDDADSPPQQRFHDRLGASLAWNGELDLLAVGIPGDDTTPGGGCPPCPCPELGDCQGSGKVSFYFRRSVDDWVMLVRDLKADPPRCREYFATSLAWSEDEVVIGAPSDTNHCEQPQGSIYVYDGRADVLTGPVQAGDAHSADFFGASVAGNGTTLAIGAPGADGLGATYLADAADPNQQLIVNAMNPMLGDAFGTAVAVDDDEAFIGSPNDDTVGSVTCVPLPPAPVGSSQ